MARRRRSKSVNNRIQYNKTMQKRLSMPRRDRLFLSNTKKLALARSNDLSVLQHKTPRQMRQLLHTLRRISNKNRPLNRREQRQYSAMQLHGGYVDSLREFNTKICRSRSIRREVIFALNKQGMGAKAKKFHDHTSQVRCK